VQIAFLLIPVFTYLVLLYYTAVSGLYSSGSRLSKTNELRVGAGAVNRLLLGVIRVFLRHS